MKGNIPKMVDFYLPKLGIDVTVETELETCLIREDGQLVELCDKWDLHRRLASLYGKSGVRSFNLARTSIAIIEEGMADGGSKEKNTRVFPGYPKRGTGSGSGGSGAALG